MKSSKKILCLLFLVCIIASIWVLNGVISDKNIDSPIDLPENKQTENISSPQNSNDTNTDIPQQPQVEKPLNSQENNKFNISDVPEFYGTPYVIVNKNVPFFTEEDMSKFKSFEYYSGLDELNRCGYCVAFIGKDMMPLQERGSIGSVKPSGWHTIKYDIVDGKYLYNRCHLIGYQLTGENANEKNLITGTRYLNIQGMLPFENMVADYIKETNNHVLYRATPIFIDNELVARGVLMEGYSVEDKGSGIKFCIFAYNSQPGIKINYLTGASELEYFDPAVDQTSSANETKYILNTSSKKYHLPTCPYANKISSTNKKEYIGNEQDLTTQGYSPCKNCNP